MQDDVTQPFLVFGSPLIEQPEIDEVVACMQSAWLGTGLRVAQFERDFERFAELHFHLLQAPAVLEP